MMAQFDHHWGILLSNRGPTTFHIHTIVPTPNGTPTATIYSASTTPLTTTGRGATFIRAHKARIATN